MTSSNACAGFAALSHPVRLSLFRELAARAPYGVSAGELATGFEVPPSTMTGHLKALEQAGLVLVQKKSRFMIYFLNTAGAHSLVRYLSEDCLGLTQTLTDDV
ncbi:MAG: metalloregulator ArsR/SmtB family transcription factor [Maricaulis sp.]|jgi:DNA-binding transcriptional ArsR family regulator|nr:metalloregulator ArsR/SmtB family transcription factor [Maricaulis sp.]MDG2043815.1 metalloregulator ArsR/SmtB family transcription factor [Maricaulis sp.]